MNFNEAYQKMLEGKKIKRPDWKGYWFIDSKDNKFKIKLAGGEIKENKFTQETIKNTAANDWEIVEEPKSKDWKPKKGDKYYCIGNAGSIFNYDYREDILDEARLNIGNYFKTEEEAKHMVEKLKVIHELQKFANENNEEKIDWNDAKQFKQFLIYDIEDKKVCFDYKTYVKNEPFNIYFTSFDIARKAIKKIGEYRIKKYYFDIEE